MAHAYRQSLNAPDAKLSRMGLLAPGANLQSASLRAC